MGVTNKYEIILNTRDRLWGPPSVPS